VFVTVQNHAMRIHHRVFGGNFVFGKALMIVDYETAEREIVLPGLRGNRFMGVDLVSNDPGAFVTNAGTISTAAPVRTLVREYIAREIMTPEVRGLDLESLATKCKPLLDEWAADPKMATVWPIRGAVTRLFIQILAGKTIPKVEADEVTQAYATAF